MSSLSKREAMALRVLAECVSADPEFAYMRFSTIGHRSGLEQKHVRRTVRALARKGMAEYGKGLWTEDGDMAGSGYRCTDLGRTTAIRLELTEG